MEIPDRDVCMGATSHARVVHVNFDPEVIAFDEILDVFFPIHVPTTLDRQGNDVGSQYRSASFSHSPEQKAAAEKKVRAVAVEFASPITEVTPASQFFMAEDYHQEYFRLKGHQPHCQFVVLPQVSKFGKLFAAKRDAS
jgi:peptide-methionine (S)-S-oxide reductase